MLASLAGAALREEACGFALDSKLTKEIVFRDLLAFQKDTVRVLVAYLRSLPTPPLGRLVRKLK
ncbi:MAG: hypothetical protein HY537_05565 [Deltaproteobacteria bacterium]|nr:hypothetical protein [Deltaproteobacteria bacterium]